MINDMTNEHERFIRSKSKVFFENNYPVHIVKWGSSWSNGYILDVDSDFLILKEFKFGEMPIFFKEIKSIEKYEKRSEDDRDQNN